MLERWSVSLRVRFAVACGALLALAAEGCRPERPSMSRPAAQAGPRSAAQHLKAREDDPVVARIGGYEVRLSEVRRRFEELPVHVRMRFQSREGRREFLETYLEFLALVHAAQPLSTDAEVVDAVKSEAVTRFLRDQVDRSIRTQDVRDDEVQAYYESHRHEFERPEQFEVRQVVVRDAALAARIAWRAAKRTASPGADPVEEFSRLVERFSEDPVTRRRNGVVGRFPWMQADGPPPVPEPVVEAAARLEHLYQIAGPVEAPDGYHILFAARRFEAVAQSLEQARPVIVERLMDERKARRRREFIEDLVARSTVEVDPVVARTVREQAAGAVPDAENPK